MGLKLAFVQSLLAAAGTGLNRTSVGLKQWRRRLREVEEALPQSNQRGIETAQKRADAGGTARGLNRTSVGLKPRRVTLMGALSAWGLNRTSVGLKLGFNPEEALDFCRLNRTSVGLKREIPLRQSRVASGLNRTSVGLKPGTR